MEITKIKILREHSDGTWDNFEAVMPFDVAQSIACDVIDWKGKFSTTGKAHEDFLESEKRFDNKWTGFKP